jgi:hypothetical protein
MPEISGRTLAVVIQALDEKIGLLQVRIESLDADDSDLPDVEDELLSCTKAADELRGSYAVALKSIGNLPPYSHLVKHG